MAYEFNPDVGSFAGTLADLARGLVSDHGGALAALRESVSEGVHQGDLEPVLAESDRARFLFSASLLLDLVTSGGKVWVRDSRIFAAWPDWDGPAGREAARHALAAAGELRPLTSEEITRVSPLFAPDTDGRAVARALEEGEFTLVEAEDYHPSGIRYMDGFSAALRLWTMPYRGRQGRQKRFLLLCRHQGIAEQPVIAGIIEMGDEAPFCTWRDALLGLAPDSVMGWLRREAEPATWAALAAKHLRRVRGKLLTSSQDNYLSREPAAALASRQVALELLAAGRSMTGGDFQEQKRIAYAVRLARGELAFAGLASGRISLTEGPTQELAAGVRAIHDLVLPRVHMEASVCGPVPPFSYGLAGKLVVAFLAHPRIVALPSAARGSVLGQSFNLKGLAPLLPKHGMLALTTKGLYARHAPMYHRAAVPGIAGPLRVEHIHNTEGTTSTLLSSQTAAFARLVLETSKEKNRRQVSLVYGSGGAKRHRTLETAASLCGLSEQLVSAGIRRPVYSFRFADNPEEVIWAGADPQWRIDVSLGPEAYCARAVEMWRSRWLSKAVTRLDEYAFIPSPTISMGDRSAE